MQELRELMEEAGFEPDTSEVDHLMHDQHYGSSLTVGFKLMGDYDYE